MSYRQYHAPNKPFVGRWLGVFAILFALFLTGAVRAQDHIVAFSTTDPGITRSITNWGLDTGWPNYDNMQRGLIFMGTNTVNLVQVAFEMYAPLTNNDITPAMKLDLTNMVTLASQTSTNAKWIMSSGTGGGVDASYQSGTGTVYPDRWASMMSAWQRNYKTNFPNRTMWLAQPFNEPDYGWGQGSQQNLYDILGYLQLSNNFAGVRFGGGCTLDCGAATSWYNAIASRVSVGTTHCLNGSVASYVGFIQTVLANNGIPFDSEIHNLGEVIIGANYGIQGGTWWGTAELARGSFATACQGKRLGYADDWANFTAAAVYRGSNGAVQAFLGGDERHGVQTSYQFFSKDRDVFYNGYGPQRDYTVTNPGYAEGVVNVTWGADVQPAISGRYLIVNHNSGKVLEVPGAGTANGIQLDQNTYTGALNQQWDINPLPNTFGGDCSYYTIRAAHDGVTADLNNYSYASGAAIQQWNGGTNTVEQWYFQYTTNGYFKIRSRWSNKVMGVNGASTGNGALILQWDDNGTLDHEWRLIPATVSAYDFIAPAAPTGVTATANAVSAQLNWNMNTESDLAGYTVLRATNSGGPYEICARGLTNSAFTDKSANQVKTYHYVVKAADRSLNSSANSAQVSATPTGNPALVAHYAFDGNANDSSGNANDATTTGPPIFVAGENGSAMSLNGTSQYAMVPANMLAGVTNYTIATWVYWNGGSAWQRIFDFGNDTTQYMFLTPSSGSGTLRFAVTTNGNGAEQMLQTASALPVGQWVHVAITRNGNIAKLYTNGAVVVSATNVITITPASFNPALNYLGKSQYADPLFNGRLDDLFLYNYALSDPEITRLAANQPPPPTTPTTLSTVLAGNMLDLSWPSNYVGCQLQVQTNSPNAGLGTNWVDVSGSSVTNNVAVPLDATKGSVFYRLVYP
jgi:hypothetical protein